LRRLWALHYLVSGWDRYYRGSCGDPGVPRAPVGGITEGR